MNDEQSVAEIRSVMYQMAERYGAGDVDGVMALFIEDGPMNIGTGADEARMGFDEVRRLIARDVSEVDRVAMNMDSLSVNVIDETLRVRHSIHSRAQRNLRNPHPQITPLEGLGTRFARVSDNKRKCRHAFLRG